MSELIDITLPLSCAVVPWPGDQPFRRDITLAIASGSSVNLSAITSSLHNGTHADAPFHYRDDGLTMEGVALDVFIGPARLIECFGEGEIAPAELLAAERLLIKTAPEQDRTRFPAHFRTLSVAAVEWLAAQGCRLIGVDVPSVDLPDSKSLPVHQAIGRAGIQILENLVLEGVPAGEYELIALPLRIAGGDGSPVRAVLRPR